MCHLRSIPGRNPHKLSLVLFYMFGNETWTGKPLLDKTGKNWGTSPKNKTKTWKRWKTSFGGIPKRQQLSTVNIIWNYLIAAVRRQKKRVPQVHKHTEIQIHMPFWRWVNWKLGDIECASHMGLSKEIGNSVWSKSGGKSSWPSKCLWPISDKCRKK